MENETEQEGSYYIVAPGSWAGTPKKYTSLKDALRDFLGGSQFKEIHGSDGERPERLNLTRELAFSDISMVGNCVSAKCLPEYQSKGQTYYLVKTYTFKNEGNDPEGYVVTKCSNLHELQSKANESMAGVRQIRNILTRGLEVKLEE